MSRTRSIQALLIAALLAINLLAIAASAYWLHQSKEQYIQRAEIQSRNIANAVERNLAASIEKIDFALQHLVDDVEQHLRASGALNQADMQTLFAHFQSRLPEVEGLRVADAQGNLILRSSVPLTAPMNITDRDYFVALRDDSDARL